MKKAKDNVCPRCKGLVPNAERVGQYVGALSRVSDHEICSACGTDEAMRDFQGLQPIFPVAWPVKHMEPMTVALQAALKADQ